MPLYEYRCSICGHRFEVLQRVGEGAETLRCGKCGAGEVERQLSTFAGAVASGSASRGAMAGSCGASRFT